MERSDKLAAIMPPSPKIICRISPEIEAEIDKFCEKHGLELSDFIRQAICEKMGKSDLLATMRSAGRPWPAKKTTKRKKLD